MREITNKIEKPLPRLWSNVGHRPFCPLRIVADPVLGEADADATEQKGLWEARILGIKKM